MAHGSLVLAIASQQVTLDLNPLIGPLCGLHLQGAGMCVSVLALLPRVYIIAQGKPGPKKMKRSPAVCGAVYGIVLRFIHWRGPLEGTSSRFIYHRGIQEGTLLLDLWVRLGEGAREANLGLIFQRRYTVHRRLIEPSLLI